MKKIQRALLALVLLCSASMASAQLVVPSGSSFALGGGSLDLGGSSLQVDGLFSLTGGRLVDLTGITIASGGTLDGSGGQISLSGDWSNSGNFLGGGGQVNFIDGPASSQVLGNTTFANASFVSANGKNYLFGVGTTQTISGLLTIAGAAGTPIQFRSTAAGQVANIDLLGSGSQSIAHVGVSDVHATGQQLAPNLKNEGGSGNALGWFGAAVVAGTMPATALSPIGMLLFAFALFAGVWLTRRHPSEI